jgi:uncharacterized membrane protein YfcA
VTLAYIVSGALVGLVVGATGVGGGSLMTPLLTMFFGVPASVAVGTDLLFAAATKTAGAASYARRRLVPWSLVGRLALGSVPASLVTTGALHLWNPDAAAFGALVRPALGVALLLTASAVLLRERARFLSAGPQHVGFALAGAGAAPSGAIGLPDGATDRAWRTVAAGALLGVLVTITSVGAGAIGVVALFALYPVLPVNRLVGADIAHAVPLTLVAGLGHAALGTVDWTLLGALLLGSIPAIHVGALLARRLPEPALRIALATILVIVGVRMLGA